jgi:acetylornithine deacetylase
MLARLIGFDTTSRKSDLELIDFVRNDLDTGQANLSATIGPPDRAGLVLSGHTDVETVDRAAAA